MILKALYDYYQRCDDLAPAGMEYKEIGFLIVIKEDGTFEQIEECKIDKKNYKTFLVAKAIKRSGSKAGEKPCILWDNTSFIVGVEKKGKPNPKGQYMDAFIKLVNELSKAHPQNKRIIAVKRFYDKYKETNLINILSKDELYDEFITTQKNISFRIKGDTKIVAEDSELCRGLQQDKVSIDEGYCLVTGIKGEIARIHSKTPLPGFAFSSLVSFMTEKGYDSYGKTQAYNAPVSIEAEFGYTTALNKLLNKDSHNKFMVGSRTFVFWASSNNEASKQAEESLFDLLGFAENDDDPNRRIENVRAVFKSIYSGQFKTTLDDNDKFYILGLAPNSARIAVVYWSEIPLKEFAEKICRHFEDMEVIDTRKEQKPYFGLHSVLGAVTLGGKSTDVTPNLPDAVVKSIFQGEAYPASLFQSCIRRIRAEVNKELNDKKLNPITITRVAILKAYLNRINDNNNKQISIMLDKENTNPGYLCGRLFAVMETLQYAANGQDSIRSSYMNAASSTPSAVFSTILKLSNNHFGKLAKDNKGLAVFFDKQKEEIISMLQEFPDTLDLQEQGRFFLGYYHQKNYKENKETEE